MDPKWTDLSHVTPPPSRMSLHRVRSHSADTKKAREPRRLTEKIAIMKRKEHEQSEAFEKAMKSIMEVNMCKAER